MGILPKSAADSRMADKALYMAKAAGKNQVKVLKL